MSQKELNRRHRRWIKLIEDYDCVIHYHPEKANIVVDALSQKNKAVESDPIIWDEKESTGLRKICVQLDIGPEWFLLA